MRNDTPIIVKSIMAILSDFFGPPPPLQLSGTMKAGSRSGWSKRGGSDATMVMVMRNDSGGMDVVSIEEKVSKRVSASGRAWFKGRQA